METTEELIAPKAGAGAATLSRSDRRRQVLNLAMPAVGEQLLNTLVGMSDTFLVGHLSASASAKLGYGSAQALASVGLANQIVWIFLVFLMAVGVGSTALIARARGAGDQALADRALHQSMILGMGFGLIIAMLGPLIAAPSLLMLGAGNDVLPLGTEFLIITTSGFVPASLLVLGTAALRGAGDTRTPLLIMLGVNALNIALSYLLINGYLGAPTLGSAGAATGAAVARGLGGLAIVALLLRGRSGLRLPLSLRPDFDILRRILRVGAPSGGEQLIFQAGLVVFITFVTNLGTAAYAAHTTVLTIESVAYLPGQGYATAASALVGRWIGAGDPQEAEATTYEALLQGCVLLTVLGAIMAIFPHQLVSLFVNDQAVIRAADATMRIAGLCQSIMAFNFIVSGALRGAGDTRWPLVTKLISTWCVRLPVVLALVALGLGLPGIWIGMKSDYLAQGALAYWRFRGGRWKNMRV
jgi:putative MATE family efflux protein